MVHHANCRVNIIIAALLHVTNAMLLTGPILQYYLYQMRYYLQSQYNYSSIITCTKCNATYRANIITAALLLVANAMLLAEPILL